MSSEKPKKSASFTFVPSNTRNPALIKKTILTVLAIPSNDILGLGIISSLGALSIVVSRAVINPIQTEPTSVNVSAFVNQSHSAALFFVVLSALFAAFFWIITALYTRKTMLWISKKLSSENLFISLQIVMLLLFWLPLTTSFALNNPSHQTEITTIGFGMIVVAGILFTAEDLLRKFWKIEY